MACAIGYVVSVLCPGKEPTPIHEDLLYNYNENFLVKRWCGRSSGVPEENGQGRVKEEAGKSGSGSMKLNGVRQVDPARRTRKWCRRHRVPSKIEEHPEEDAALIHCEEKV